MWAREAGQETGARGSGWVVIPGTRFRWAASCKLKGSYHIRPEATGHALSPWPQQSLIPGLLELVLPLSLFSQSEKSRIVFLCCA